MELLLSPVNQLVSREAVSQKADMTRKGFEGRFCFSIK